MHRHKLKKEISDALIEAGLNPLDVTEVVLRSLHEDVDERGDVTSLATIPADHVSVLELEEYRSLRLYFKSSAVTKLKLSPSPLTVKRFNPVPSSFELPVQHVEFCRRNDPPSTSSPI